MHTKFLKHLNGSVVTSLNEEINQMSQRPVRELGEESARQQLLRWLRLRWQFDDPKAKDRSHLALPIALLLHKYGWSVTELVDAACNGMDVHLESVQPKAFERLRSELRPLLETAPTPLKRRPRAIKNSTQFRQGDVFSIRFAGRYFVAFVLDISSSGVGETSPLVSFFDGVYSEPVTLDSIGTHRAKGRRYNNGLERPERLCLWGLNYLPDPAGQIALLGSAQERAPDTSHLDPPIGFGTVSRLTDLAGIVEQLWSHD